MLRQQLEQEKSRSKNSNAQDQKQRVKPNVSVPGVPNFVAEAARGLGCTDDTVRRALSAAAVREGRQIGSLNEAVAVFRLNSDSLTYAPTYDARVFGQAGLSEMVASKQLGWG